MLTATPPRPWYKKSAKAHDSRLRVEHTLPQCQNRRLFVQAPRSIYLRGLLIQTRLVLNFAQLSIGVGRRVADAGRQQTALLGALEQGDIAHVVAQPRMTGRICKHQILHRKLDIHHPARAVFDVKQARFDGRAARSFCRMLMISCASAVLSRGA